MKIRVLMIGDVVGTTGIAMFQKHINHLRSEYRADAVIVNGENSASNGRGIIAKTMKFFKHCKVDVVTSGNHIWDHREIYTYLHDHKDLLRPANFPAGAPGVGVTVFSCKNERIAVVNLQGRVFMREHVDCPFVAAETILSYLKHQTKMILVDFHAEATSEKMGLGYFLDGQVSAVVGTHTHTQTADERILPNGTAYISDLGMVGALESMLGMKKEPIINKFITQLPTKFEVETEGPGLLSGVCIELDSQTGKALSIERIKIVDTDFQSSQIQIHE